MWYVDCWEVHGYRARGEKENTEGVQGMMTIDELVEKIVERYDPEEYIEELSIDIESLVHLTKPYLAEYSFRFREIIQEIEEDEESEAETW